MTSKLNSSTRNEYRQHEIIEYTYILRKLLLKRGDQTKLYLYDKTRYVSRNLWVCDNWASPE